MLDYSLSDDDSVETIKVIGNSRRVTGKVMLGTPYSSKTICSLCHKP